MKTSTGIILIKGWCFFMFAAFAAITYLSGGQFLPAVSLLVPVLGYLAVKDWDKNYPERPQYLGVAGVMWLPTVFTVIFLSVVAAIAP